MINFDNTYGPKIARAAGTYFNPECDIAISRVENDQLLGGVIFTNYTGASIGIHVAGFHPRWLSRDMLWVIFNYSFIQLNCKTVFGQVPVTNSKALEFDKKIGFNEVARIADVFPDGDLILLRMRREDCRWLKLTPQHLKDLSSGQQEQRSSSP
jgi:RimJ/RimL family protein N-acetyltransferase